MLSDTLDALLLIHALRREKAYRSLPKWDEAYIEAAPLFKSKKDTYNLMNPRKRRLLYKLMALSYIQGGRKISLLNAEKRNEVKSLRVETNQFLRGKSDHDICMNKRLSQRCLELSEKWGDLILLYESTGEDSISEAFLETDVEEWLVIHSSFLRSHSSFNFLIFSAPLPAPSTHPPFPTSSLNNFHIHACTRICCANKTGTLIATCSCPS